MDLAPGHLNDPRPIDPHDLRLFVIQLGAAMSASGQPVDAVQERLRGIVRAYGAGMARVSVFPTYLMVAMGRGEAATLELTPAGTALRLDQVAALERLVARAERGAVRPLDGLRRLSEIAQMSPRFGPVLGVVGCAALTLGLSLILRPALQAAATALVLGAVVGGLRSVGRGQPQVQTLLPFVAAFVVSTLSALAVRHEIIDPSIAAMVASLVVFLPGAAMTTAVLELAAGQMVAGASRLVWAVMHLALLAFGIVAGTQAAGIPYALAFADSGVVLGDWVRWLGVAVFAVGVVAAYSAPARALPGLLIVLYAAWAGQLVGNAVLGGYVSAFVGALVMTPVATWVSRLPTAMPPHASFLPGFWLLVPGALGLIGLAQLAGDADSAGTEDLVATVVSIFAVAVGVLAGTLVQSWVGLARRAVARRLPNRP